MTYINEYAFTGCTNLTTLTLPSSATSVGNCAFKDCTGLSSVTINGNIGDCSSNSANSNNYSSNYYTNISVFYNAGANADSLDVTFGDSVTYVPAYLFATASSESDGYYAHVTSVTFSTRLKEIGDYAFYDCYDLESITFVRSAPTIGDNSFGNVQAYAYYPSQFSSWDNSTMLDYGGDLTWLSYVISEDKLSGDTLMVRRGNKYYFNYVLKGGSADFSITFGDASDQVLVGDWDGDGIDTICVRRGNVCYFISNSIANPDYGVDTFTFGRAGDEVYAGTWS